MDIGIKYNLYIDATAPKYLDVENQVGLLKQIHKTALQNDFVFVSYDLTIGEKPLEEEAWSNDEDQIYIYDISPDMIESGDLKTFLIKANRQEEV